MIPWVPEDEREVEKILLQHPVQSGRCVQAARHVLVVAQRIDNDAKTMLIKVQGDEYSTRGARFLCLKKPWSEQVSRWFHHANVHVVEHYVDALTGSSGHDESTYLERFFLYSEWLGIVI